GAIAARRYELESRTLVDKAADQPGRGDAVDLHALAGHPDAVGKTATRRGFARRHVVLSLQLRLETGHQALRGKPAVGAEEIDGDHGIELLAQARDLRRHLG